MQLLIDAGNSRIKWAALTSDSLTATGGAPISAGAEEQAFAAAWAQFERPSAIAVASVRGEVFQLALQNWLSHRWAMRAQFVCTQATGWGVFNAYRQPEQLGIDRWLALIAARHAYQGALCVIDCGTAITLDAMDAQGRHQGGVIAPGLTTMRESLGRNTHALRIVPTAGKPEVFARDTAAGILGGTHFAAVGLIERTVYEMQLQLENDLQVLITGGDAEAVMPFLQLDYRHEPQLVLQGLAIAVSDPP